MPKFKKGDRIEFQFEGNTIYGIVDRGGAKTKVIEDGAQMQYGVPESALKLSEKPIKKGDPHPMDVWDVVKYKENSAFSEETVCFTAEVTKNGKRVIAAKNDGHGGCTGFYPLAGGYEIINEFETAAKNWLVDHGMPEERCFESADEWIGWKVGEAPYGITASDHVKRSVDRWNEISNSADNAGFKI